MIGFYDYTVVLTYCSVASAVVGVLLSVTTNIHPFIPMALLMFSGLCDAFDGKVARSKKNRTQEMKNFGIQIDSLSDVIAFGLLPVCIGAALWKQSEDNPMPFALMAVISVLYVLGAVIRLAYFNVTEDELQASGKGKREFYQGLPVTSAALIFPSFLLLAQFIPVEIEVGYHILMLLTALAFVGKFRIRKPGMGAVMILVGIGLLEVILYLISLLCH